MNRDRLGAAGALLVRLKNTDDETDLGEELFSLAQKARGRYERRLSRTNP